MEPGLTSSLKRKKQNESSISKQNYEQIVQSLQSTPPRKAPKKSEIAKIQSSKPEELFKNFLQSDRRASTGFEIKSKNVKKKGKTTKNKVIEESIDEIQPEKIKEIQTVFTTIRQKTKKSDEGKKDVGRDYRYLVTPIAEKRSENASVSPVTVRSVENAGTPSPRTPQDNVIRIPSSYKRQRITRHRNILKN